MGDGENGRPHCGTGLKLFTGRDFSPPLIFRRIVDLLHDFGVKQEGKGLDPVDYNPETSYQDISYAIVRKSSIRPLFESLDLAQRPKILEATYLAKFHSRKEKWEKADMIFIQQCFEP